MKKYRMTALDKNAQKAMREAVLHLVKERKRLGIPLSIWKNGKVVTIPAKKINLKSLGL